jgi:hypothetical protein
MAFPVSYFFLWRKPKLLLTSENRFTPHDLCDDRHEERVEACVQTLLDAEDNTSQKGADLVTCKKQFHSEVREGL